MDLGYVGQLASGTASRTVFHTVESPLNEGALAHTDFTDASTSIFYGPELFATLLKTL